MNIQNRKDPDVVPDRYHTAVRLQLAALGYAILPNVDKVCRVGGWNAPDWVRKQLASNGKGSTTERINRWPQRFPDYLATGVRLENGLGAIDADVDDADMVARLADEIRAIAPGLLEQAPCRFGGGVHKFALFCTVAGERWNRVASRTYNGHAVEIFGGAPLRSGGCSRQFGIYGPHSHNDDGTVAREYAWADGPQLHETPVGELPALTKAQALAIVTAFERLAVEAGWTAAAGPDVDAGEVVYDLTGEMRFDSQRGAGLTYTELCEEVEAFGETRCSAAFMPGRGEGGQRDRCWVFWSERFQCAGIYVYGDAQTHLPAEAAPNEDLPGLAEGIKELAAREGVELPVPVPTWRECYAGTTFPKASLDNVRRALLVNGIVCTHDSFHDRMVVSAAAPRADMTFLGSVNDASVMALRLWLSHHYGKDFTETHVRDAVVGLGWANAFDPVADMLADAEAAWDGVERLDRMAVDYFMAADTVLNRAMVRKTMIAAVTRVRRPGCKFDNILTMESPEGWNKSSAWSVLAGPENFSDVRIIGATEKEVMEQLAGVWIHENAELAGMKKTEVEMVKAFASRQVDIARPAYGRFTRRQPRHSIEVGTTNAEAYLPSVTGNRRFWPIRVLAPIDLVKLSRDRLQLWGEAAALQSAGESVVLAEELWPVAAEAQEERRMHHPWEALLGAMTVAPDSGPLAGAVGYGPNIITRVGDEERVLTQAIFKYLELSGARTHMGHASDLANVMRTLGWTKKKIRVGSNTLWGYSRWVTQKLRVVS